MKKFYLYFFICTFVLFAACTKRPNMTYNQKDRGAVQEVNIANPTATAKNFKETATDFANEAKESYGSSLDKKFARRASLFSKVEPIPNIAEPAQIYDFNQEIIQLEKLPVTLKFNSIDLRSALTLFAGLVNRNIIIGQEVQGMITLNFDNIKWGPAVYNILEMNNLIMLVDAQSGILRVHTKDKFIEYEKKKIDQTKEIKNNIASLTSDDALVTATNTANAAVPGTVQNDDTTTEIFKIFYRTPADVTTALQSVVNDITVTQDSANNQLIVTGTKSQLNQVSDVLDKIDIEKNQVMIEAYILSATDGFTKSFDANLQAAYAQKTGRDGPITNIVAGSNPTNETAITAATIGGDPVSSIATSGAVILGRIGMTQLKAIINASISDTNSETISNPKLFAMDGEQASLVQGLTLIKELAGSGAQAGDIKQIPQNLNLTVTPRVIGNGDKIEVDFSLANDSPGESVGDNTTTNNENINSKILINAGEVAILGGVYKNNKTDNITFVPFFRNIPILGSFFKTKTKSDTKSQLLIFLTATVV